MTNQEKRDINRHDALYSGKDAPLTLGVRCGMPRKSSLLHRGPVRAHNRNKKYRGYRRALEAEEQRLRRSTATGKARAKELAMALNSNSSGFLKNLYNKVFGK